MTRFTHTGVVESTPENPPLGVKMEVRLKRARAGLWEDHSGRFFLRESGVMVPQNGARPFSLRLSSVKQLPPVILTAPPAEDVETPQPTVQGADDGPAL